MEKSIMRGLFFFLLSLFVLSVMANDIDKKVYQTLPAPVPCTRWLNSTGQIGCSSKSEGAYGIFWPIESHSDLDRFIKTGRAHSHTIVVLDGHLLTPEVVKKLEMMKEVKGLVVNSASVPMEQYSETSAFPQHDTTTAGESESYLWNIPAHDLLHHEYKWPVWSLDETSASHVVNRARLNVASGTRHGALLKQFMFGYRNSETCLHYKFCEPVGGHSVWGILPAMLSSTSYVSSSVDPSNTEANVHNERDAIERRQYIATLSRLDAISLFAGQAIGAEADMSGLIANLAALTTLAGINNLQGDNPPGYEAVDPSQFKYPILWAFFDAEHWGYPGSTRFVHDWTQFECLDWADAAHTACNYPFYPTVDFTRLKLNNFKNIIEMRQVGVPRPSDQKNMLFIHQHEHHFGSTLIQRILEAQTGLNASVETASITTPGLPPSSAFTFLNAANAEKSSLKEDIVIISDHDEHYVNRFYGSRYDLASQLNLQLLTDAATLLARTLYTAAMDVPGEQSLSIKVNSTLVATWLHCLTENTNCALARRFLPTLITSATPTKPNHYHGPYFDNAFSISSKLTHDYMIYISRNRSLDNQLTDCTADSNCTSSNPTARCVLEKCISSSYVAYHDSYSVGLKRNANGGWNVADPSLPNWVEPYWDNPKFELISVGNPAKERGFLTWSIFQTIFFIAGIIIFKRFVKDKYEKL